MFNRMKKISLTNWILIGLILGILNGIFLNVYGENFFVKTFLMENIFKLVGDLFIKLMKMLVVPLVFFSIVVSLSSITDMNKLKTIGLRTILLFILCGIISMVVALIIGFTIKPGVGVNLPVAMQTSPMASNQTMTSLLLNMIPENSINALSNGDVLPVIIFGIIVSVVLLKLGDETSHVQKLFNDLNEITIEATKILMKISPIGIFCLMTNIFGTLGFKSFIPLTKLIICIILGLFIINFVLYPLMIIIFTRLNPLIFHKKFLPVTLFAFSTNSSNATIPLSLEIMEEMGVDPDIASFTVPLGAIFNKNGHTIAFTLIALFAAQVSGMDLGSSVILMLIVSVLITANTAPSVPLGGIFSLEIIFSSVGLPLPILELITGVYNIIEMMDTAINVTGDAICTIIVAFKDKSLDLNVFNGKKEPENQDIN